MSPYVDRDGWIQSSTHPLGPAVYRKDGTPLVIATETLMLWDAPARAEVAGPFETLEAAKVAYLIAASVG